MAGTAVISNSGRPRKTDFHDVSYATLNRRAHEMAEKFDVATIQLALDIAKKNGKYVDACNNEDSSIVPHSYESAFAIRIVFRKRFFESAMGTAGARFQEAKRANLSFVL